MHLTLTWFDAGDYRIDGMIMDTPTSNLYTAYRQTLIYGGVSMIIPSIR